jgi:hypothetical protein
MSTERDQQSTVSPHPLSQSLDESVKPPAPRNSNLDSTVDQNFVLSPPSTNALADCAQQKVQALAKAKVAPFVSEEYDPSISARLRAVGYRHRRNLRGWRQLPDSAKQTLDESEPTLNENQPTLHPDNDKYASGAIGEADVGQHRWKSLSFEYQKIRTTDVQCLDFCSIL